MSDTQGLASRWRDLRRHPAFQVAAVYAGASWALIQVADIFFPNLRAIRWLGILLILGFLAVVGIAWRAASITARAGRGAISADAESGDSSSPIRRRRRYAYTAAIGLLLLGGVFWWIRPNILGAVAPDAQVIAVLPFNTSGPGVELLGEGMVDLLSRNLDGVGGIRAVDSRTVLHRWRLRAVEGGLDLEGSLAVGRDVEAGAVLVGSVISVGPEVRLSADLLTVRGMKLASSQVEGHADSVLALVDRLGLDLLREIWLAREPIPHLRVSGITTSSVDAIRAYLKGEQHYRRSQWDSARIAFGEAVAEDSTFALAHYRLALAYGWAQGHGAPAARRHSEAALRHVDRLPARERVLVVANQLFGDGRLAAHDTMQRYVARYPDDAEGWYMLGDVRYHAQPLLALPPADLLSPFDRVLELDPSLTPAFIHPIELSITYDDSAAFHRYLEALETAAPPSEIELYRAAGAAFWGRPDSVRQQLAKVSHARLAGATGAALLHSQRLTPEQLIEFVDLAMEASPTSGQARVESLLARAFLLAGLGRLAGAKALFDSLWAIDPQGGGFPSLAVVHAGYADSAFAGRALEILHGPLPNPAFQQVADYAFMVYALSQGDAARARRLAQQMASADTSIFPNLMPGLITAGQGWADLLDGDTVVGLEKLKSGLEQIGYVPIANRFSQPFRFQRAAALAARPETREEGIRRLRAGYGAGDAPYMALSFFVLGGALEEAGDVAGAAQAYDQFIWLWANADPELQPRVDAARRALERLAAERIN